jgi:polyferredoxin
MSRPKLLEFFPTSISKKQASDSGMAVVLILLIIGLLTQNILYLKLAIPFLVMNMIFPMFYYAFAIVWLGFSHLLGTVVSKIILSVVFIFLVLPVGLFRRLLGKDALQLSKFKKGEGSVMHTRNKTFVLKDIEKPY